MQPAIKVPGTLQDSYFNFFGKNKKWLINMVKIISEAVNNNVRNINGSGWLLKTIMLFH